ncbi:MAG TPA: TIR domain-containing protein [Jatrophihabitantaceae bacterium]|nr:TIR domain-containing protein [Jatrophihabitantaceae bacterium]
MADYALAVDLGAEVTAAISDDEGPRVVPIGDADQLTMPAAVDAAGRLLVGDAAARWAGEPDLLWWKEQPAGSTVAPDDTAEHVVSEAERRVSQQVDGRFAALVVTTPTAFPADAALLLVARLSQRYRGRRIDTHPAVCAAAEFAVHTGALTPDSRLLVVDWRSASLDLAVVRWSAPQFEIVSQPFMDESLPTGAMVTTGAAQIDLATLRAAFATVLSAADSPVTVALLVGSAASSDAVRDAVSATLPSTRVARVADEAVVLGGASRAAALLALSPRESPPDYPDATAPIVDDDVQFTVYRPRSVHPEEWRRLLVFAHKTEPFESHGVRVDPIQQVAQEADALLGQESSSYVQVARDSDADLPRGTTIRFVPDVEGVEFNPPVREFSWQLPVHREEFLFRAARRLQGRVAHGLLSVYVGTVLVADVSLSIRVDSGSSESDPEPVPASRYRKIFASYSHLDAAIVENVGRVMAAIGDEFMRDVDSLRSGQIWSTELEGYIRECDVFQLYWSSNSMTSDLVSNEWHYALALNRPGFIRPVYWEMPRPVLPERNLPPPELDRLHFSYLPVRIEPPRPAEPSHPETPAGQAPVTTTGQAPVASAEAGPPAIGSLPPVPPASAGDTPAPRRRRSTRAILAMGTAAAAVLIGGSVLVANLGTSGSHRNNADVATPTTLAPGTTFAVAPPQGASELVVSRFISNVNDRDVAGATSLVCPALQSSYARGFVDPNSALFYQWTEVLLRATRVASSSRNLTYTVTLRRATQQLPRTATFRMIERSGKSVVCGLTVE